MAETKQAKPLQVDLADQVALVTGASQGIGRAIAETLAANGATVCVLARNKEKLESLVEAITSAGGKADSIPCDVSQPDAIETLKSTSQPNVRQEPFFRPRVHDAFRTISAGDLGAVQHQDAFHLAP